MDPELTPARAWDEARGLWADEEPDGADA
jgi:hypothetical protein